MVVRSATEYLNEALSDRIKDLQNALNQAERIISKLEEENNSLKTALNSLDRSEVEAGSWGY